ncbi:MAG: NYN domain-containing protein [Anaerotignum sp.]|nr:NYN domain-containing protein [Anaerotignum sp.]
MHPYVWQNFFPECVRSGGTSDVRSSPPEKLQQIIFRGTLSPRPLQGGNPLDPIPQHHAYGVAKSGPGHDALVGVLGAKPTRSWKGGTALAKEFLLVDGYNIIHAWEDLKELAEDVSLESARQKLMDVLSNYKGTNKATIILVFDGYLVKGNIGTVYEYNNIYVVYTKEAETADHYIERVVTSLPKHYKVRVATGDGLEQLIISGQGAIRMTARELWNEVQAVETELREKFIEN